MKAQLSFLTKPIILVLVIIVMVVLIQSLYTTGGIEKLQEREIDLRTAATDTILMLSNSDRCLAYSPDASSEYANIVDKNKLVSFSSRYSNIEPDCARNYEFGWRAKITEIDENRNEIRRWEFGTNEFSQGLALRQGIITSMPIAIRYSEYDIKPGRIEIKIMDGELEKLAGLLDRACFIGKTKGTFSESLDIYLSYTAYLEDSNLCLAFGSDKACRKLSCTTEMPKLGKGGYFLSTVYNNNIIRVEI